MADPRDALVQGVGGDHRVLVDAKLAVHVAPRRRWERGAVHRQVVREVRHFHGKFHILGIVLGDGEGVKVAVDCKVKKGKEKHPAREDTRMQK